MDTMTDKSPGVDTAMARRGYNDASFLLLPILHQKVRNVENLHGKIRAFVLVALEGLRAREHEYVVCILFPRTLKGKEASWYFSLPANSITNWNTFERLFRSKYAVQKTRAALMKGLISLQK